jgi:diaminohydroxyphosphoribosylaminopyrimidine deaminase/5-amino-6-(5-phosphoribosylamino)uracil reductase
VVSDLEHMRRALRLAERGRGTTSPNPMVGAVLVSPEGVIVGTGYHRRAGGPHAEIHALNAAGPKAKSATLYCTLEPCCHHGRTGPCAHRIVEAGVARVVASVEDPNPLVRGGGLQYLRERGVEVEVGLGREESVRINEAFFTRVLRRRPFVIAKIACSLDARIAAAPGERTALTGGAALRETHRTRAEVDAIGVGSGTVLADDPLLTPRGAWRERPLARILFDRRLRTPASARVFSTLALGPVIIMADAACVERSPQAVAALQAAGASVVALAHPTVSRALEHLASIEIGSLLLEGGAGLHRAAFDEGVVDRVQMFVSPTELGPAGLPWLPLERVALAALETSRIEPLGEDVLIDGYVHRID